jgi:hypothetical protein
MSIDYSRIASSAVDSFLNGRSEEPQGHQEQNGSRGLGGVGALALGAGLALGARAVFRRARGLDLEQVGHAVQDRITG